VAYCGHSGGGRAKYEREYSDIRGRRKTISHHVLNPSHHQQMAMVNLLFFCPIYVSTNYYGGGRPSQVFHILKQPERCPVMGGGGQTMWRRGGGGGVVSPLSG